MQGLGAILPKVNIPAAEKPARENSASGSDASKVEAKNSADSFPIPSKDNYSNKNEIKPEKAVAEQVQVEGKNSSNPVERPLEKKAEAPQSDSRMTKEKALEIFAQRMQDEFNISPEEVIVAFSQMDPEQLKEAPVLSTSQFVDKLNLNPKQKEKAREIYTEMLAWSATAGITNELGSKGQTAQIKVMTEKEQQLQSRLTNLNSMSDKFFMDGSYKPQKTITSDPLQTNINPQESVEPALSTLSPGEELLETMDFDAVTEVPVAEAIETPDLAALSEKAASGLDALDMSPDEEMQRIEKLLNKLSESSSGLQQGLSAKSDVSEDLGSGKEEGFSDAQADAELNALGIENKTDTKVKSEFTKMMEPPTKAEMNENVTQIMGRAQALVKDGGGEMKMRLNPEGLGEVTLKVVVNKGEVQIEMMAADNNTKKLLEKSLVELKDSLMTHKLHVDNIKVETAQQATNNFLMDQRESAERQFQQRFLQDFMQGNHQRRNEYLDFGSATRPTSQITDQALNGLYTPSGSRKESSDRKLDLVA